MIQSLKETVWIKQRFKCTSNKHFEKKYEDMQVRLDKLYDEIEEIETLIEEVESRLYNIRQDKISGDNE